MKNKPECFFWKILYVRWNRIKNHAQRQKKVIDRGKRSKKLSEVIPDENINKKLQSFLEISPMQSEILPSHKLWDQAYGVLESFRIKGR